MVYLHSSFTYDNYRWYLPYLISAREFAPVHFFDSLPILTSYNWYDYFSYWIDYALYRRRFLFCVEGKCLIFPMQEVQFRKIRISCLQSGRWLLIFPPISLLKDKELPQKIINGFFLMYYLDILRISIPTF